MLCREEQRLYHWIIAYCATGAGAVVELGCFSGGSTARLAGGTGGDILPLASKLLQPWFDHIELHPGPLVFFSISAHGIGRKNPKQVGRKPSF